MAASIIVRPATDADGPGILELRTEYFAQRGLPPQPIDPETFWIVAEHGGDVLAVQGIIDISLRDPQVRQLIVTDTYCKSDRYGKVALKRLGEFVHTHADTQDCEMFGNILPDDSQWHAISAAHGYEVVAHVVHRKRRSERLANASSDSSTLSPRGRDDGSTERPEQSRDQEQREPTARRRRKRPKRQQSGVPAIQ